MTQREGVLELQKTFGLNHIFARMVFIMTDKNNFLEDV